ncbi:DciA family protein [Kitasatospora sp. NPDC056800]|uniref:DciA family protein n=1 Tax=Kitasatospora sp. NPDC056800 TaxID=3345948 RepID=UPI003679942E
MTQPQTGADLARTALRAARQAARTHGTAPAPQTVHPVRPATAARRGPREPEPLTEVFLALVTAHGWTLGTAGGGLRDHWPMIVGPDAAAHWHLACYDPTTRRLRITADSPAWAAQLRYQTRHILTALDQLRPGTVVAIDVRVGPAPVMQHDQDLDDRPTRRDNGSAAQPAWPLLANHHAYQELRRRMRENAAGCRAALDEAAAKREAILHRHYNWLREPEDAHRPAIEDAPTSDADQHAHHQRERHRAALAVARATRAGAIPLRAARLAPPRTGAA